MTVKPWTVMKDRIGYLLRQLPMTEPLDRLGQFIGRTVPGPSTTAEIHLGSNLGGGGKILDPLSIASVTSSVVPGGRCRWLDWL